MDMTNSDVAADIASAEALAAEMTATEPDGESVIGLPLPRGLMASRNLPVSPALLATMGVSVLPEPAPAPDDE